MSYVLELDLRLSFVPPMEEHAPGVVFTRTLSLPFVPSEGVAIFSEKLDSAPGPLGFCLKEITWDMDRQVFLAHTTVVHQDTPFPVILMDVREWLMKGWKLGSYRDHYTAEKAVAPIVRKPYRFPKKMGTEEEMIAWQGISPEERPGYFNKAFGIVTRMLADTYSGDSVAYAMHRTGLYFTREDIKERQTPATERFWKRYDEFSSFPAKRRDAWIDRITNAYPSLEESLIEAGESRL